MADPIFGSQRERTPKMEGEQSSFGNILSTGLRYGIPLAYLGATQGQVKRLRKQSHLDLDSPDYMVGAVRDLPRPNFALPYNPEVGGSSLQESMNYSLGRDSFQRSNEANFEYNNSLNRQRQEDMVREGTNRNIAAKAAADSQEKLFNAQIAASELLGQTLPDRRSTIESLFQNIDNDIYNAGVYKDTKQTMQAQEVIRNPERYSDEQRKWAGTVLSSSGMPVRGHGGLLKRKTKFAY